MKKKNDFFHVLGRLKLPKNLIVPDEKKMGKKRGRIQSVNELEVPKSGLLKKTLTKSVSELRYSTTKAKNSFYIVLLYFIKFKISITI